MRERLRRALNRHGVGGLLKLAPKNAWFALSYCAPHRVRVRRSINEFDRRFGVDTGGFAWVSSFDAPAEIAAHATNYGPIQRVDIYLQSLGIPFDEYTFIDYGCGKGRALLMASDFPFKEIIGVEYAAKLVSIARRNLELYRSCTQKCRAIRVVEGDARDFDPPSVPTVFFLYNPFDEVVLRSALWQMRSVHKGNEFRNYLIYCDPEHRSLIEADPGWEIVADHGSWVTYRSSLAAPTSSNVN